MAVEENQKKMKDEVLDVGFFYFLILILYKLHRRTVTKRIFITGWTVDVNLGCY